MRVSLDVFCTPESAIVAACARGGREGAAAGVTTLTLQFLTHRANLKIDLGSPPQADAAAEQAALEAALQER